MELALILRWLHIIGATVILGTGAGIAFFMLMAHRTNNPVIIAHTARAVVLADYLFTASAVIAQPVTGIWLAFEMGWSISEGWIVLSLILYVVVGLFWLPVVRMQTRMRDLARQAAADGTALPPKYYRLFAWWFSLGFPAFFAVLAIIWLMVNRPVI